MSELPDRAQKGPLVRSIRGQTKLALDQIDEACFPSRTLQEESFRYRICTPFLVRPICAAVYLKTPKLLSAARLNETTIIRKRTMVWA